MNRRVGLIGAGDVSGVHLEAIRSLEDAQLVGIAEVDPAVREEAARTWGVPVFPSAEALLEGAAPDVVHVTTPHDQHVDPTLAALARGVHVLQEKPLAHTLPEAQRLLDALPSRAAATPSAAGPKVGICFQNRYNRPSQVLSRMLASGELGAVRGAWASVVWTRTADYYRAKPWRGTWEHSGGGLLINQAIHTLDLLQWLLGEVETVDGAAATRRFADVIEVEDTAELLLHHRGGVSTTFYATLTAPRHRAVEIELDCERAAVELRGGIDGSLTVRWEDGRVDVLGERRGSAGGRSYWGMSHELLIRDFYARLDDPEPFWIGPREALASLEILTAAYRCSGVGPFAPPR